MPASLYCNYPCQNGFRSCLPVLSFIILLITSVEYTFYRFSFSVCLSSALLRMSVDLRTLAIF
nr:MAG TPA: hypothetical protein [Caudoviricetes sp.]